MENLSENTSALLAVLIIIAFWYLIRKIFKSFSDKINNAELHRDDLLTVLEEIRDELKEMKSPLTTSLRKQTPMIKKAITYVPSEKYNLNI